jgi:hypothetical protein
MSKDHRNTEPRECPANVGEPIAFTGRMIDLGLVGVDFTRNAVAFDIALESG